MSQTRMDKDGRYVTTVAHEFYLPCNYHRPEDPRPLQEVLEALEEAGKGLTNLRVSGSFYNDEERDRASVDLILMGDRPATEAEIRTEEARQERNRRSAEAAAQRQAESRQRSLEYHEREAAKLRVEIEGSK